MIKKLCIVNSFIVRLHVILAAVYIKGFWNIQKYATWKTLFIPSFKMINLKKSLLDEF